MPFDSFDHAQDRPAQDRQGGMTGPLHHEGAGLNGSYFMYFSAAGVLIISFCDVIKIASV